MMRLLIILLIIIIFIVLTNNYEDFVVSIKSPIDDKVYKVQDSTSEKEQQSADLLASLNKQIYLIIEHLENKYKNELQNVSRLISRLKNKNTKIEEAPSEDKSSSYTISKGELIAFCLKEQITDKFYTLDKILNFVLIHELSHIMSVTIGHTPEFYTNFKFLLKEFEEAGIYKNIDYSKHNINYCNVLVTHNPFFS
jgi:predicted metal-dependent hydrolase